MDDGGPIRWVAVEVQLIETDDAVILRRGVTQVKIAGARAAEVVRTILQVASGGPTRDEMLSAFPAPEREPVGRLFDELAARRVLEPTGGAGGDPGVGGVDETGLGVFLWDLGVSLEDLEQRIVASRIAVLGVNCISRRLVSSLHDAGVGAPPVVDYPLLRNLRMIGDDGQTRSGTWPDSLDPPVPYWEWVATFQPVDWDCLVPTSDFGGLHLMGEWNRVCVEHGLHLLPVVLQDLVGYVGPFVVPGETPCLECARARENANLDDAGVVRAAEGAAFEGQWVTGFLPSHASATADIAAVELLKAYGGLAPVRYGTLITVNLLRPELQAHRILKLPRCPVCSPLVRRSPVTAERAIFVPLA